jgi:hypothetical protein
MEGDTTSSDEDDEEDFINDVETVLAVGMAVVDSIQQVQQEETQQGGAASGKRD